MSAHTVANFERGEALKASTVEVIQRTLEKAGIIFINANDGGPGARLRSCRGSSARSGSLKCLAAIWRWWAAP